MTLRSYLLMVAAATLIAWICVAMIVTMTSPADAHAAVLGILYTAGFLALAGTYSLAGFGLRIWLLKQHYFVSRHVLIALRQGMLLALLTVIALVLASRGILSWWTALLTMGALTLFEFFFVSGKGGEEK